jgi:hypothetical protein
MIIEPFKVGEVVALRSGGPSFVLAVVGANNVQGTYYNQITGIFCSCQVPVDSIRRVVQEGKR